MATLTPPEDDRPPSITTSDGPQKKPTSIKVKAQDAPGADQNKGQDVDGAKRKPMSLMEKLAKGLLKVRMEYKFYLS